MKIKLSDGSVVTMKDDVTRSVVKAFNNDLMGDTPFSVGGDAQAEISINRLNVANDNMIIAMVESAENVKTVDSDWLDSLLQRDYNKLLGHCNDAREKAEGELEKGKKNR